jgi:hypothetical protein
MRMRALAIAVALTCVAHALPAAAQSWRTVSSSRQLRGESVLDVQVRYGAGRFSIQPAPADLLYRLQLRYDEDTFQPRTEFDGRNLDLGVDGSGGRNFRIGRNQGGEMDVELAPAVPMELEIDFGAGTADIDLGGLALTALSIRTGASETLLDVSLPNPVTLERAEMHVGAADFTARRLGNLNARRIEVNAGVGDVTIDLTGEWRQDGVVQVRMGLGSLELRFPEGIGVKLERETLLTSIDTQGLVKRGDAYYSVDWERAERRITVQVEAAFGSIDVRWVR